MANVQLFILVNFTENVSMTTSMQVKATRSDQILFFFLFLLLLLLLSFSPPPLSLLLWFPPPPSPVRVEFVLTVLAF